MKNKRLKIIITVVTILLIIPLIAMQFTDEVNWKPIDFIIAGVLLLGTGVIFDLVLRKIKNTKYQIIITVALLIVLFLIWAELAVGIFGTPFAGS